MRLIHLLYLALILLMCKSCYTYEPRFEGPYDEEAINETAFIYVINNSLFQANITHSTSSKISSNVEHASINNTHTKILYKKPNENILIYDIESKQTDEISSTSDAVSFDFATNSTTIYYLTTEGILKTKGENVFPSSEIDIGSIISPLLQNNEVTYNSCVVLADLSIIITGTLENENGVIFGIKNNQIEYSGQLTDTYLRNLRVDHNSENLTTTQVSQNRNLMRFLDLENNMLLTFVSDAAAGVADTNTGTNIPFYIQQASFDDDEVLIKRGQAVLKRYGENSVQTIDH